jgi:sucrose-6F-phosphate phosphohydrolase
MNSDRRRTQVRLFSTDLDGTLVGDAMALARFTAQWQLLPAQRRPLLVYNTGRRIADTRLLVATGLLPEPDFIIGSVGTEFHDSLYDRAEEFNAQFREGWDLARVEAIVASTPGVKRQPREFLHPFKSSWTWSRARREQVETLKRRLTGAGLQATVIYSCLHFLDVLPARADKGKALRWLCQRMNIALADVLVAGDSANDSSMFLLPDVQGIAVANALPELFTDLAGRRTYVARAAMADGVLEGLAYYGVLRDEAIKPTGAACSMPTRAA